MEANITQTSISDIRLAHVLPNDSWGGAEIYMLQLAEWQKHSGLDVTIWCTSGTQVHREAINLGLKVLTEPVPQRQVFWSLRRLSKTIRREKFTHLQIHWSGGVMTFAGIKYFCSIKVLYHPHMFIDYRKKDFFHAWAYAQLDIVFAAGERAKQSYLKNLPLKSEQIKIIAYGLDLSATPKNMLPTPEFTKWNLKPGDFYAGFMGRFDRQKGVKEFLLATIPLLEKYPQLKLLIVGEPTRNEQDSLNYHSELKKLIQSSKYSDRIIEFGFQKEFRSLLSCLNILVMPSYQETYSLMIIHAFSMGIPVLSTNDGGTPDLIGEHEERGWLVAPRSIEPIREILQKLIEHPEKIAEKKNGCVTYVHSHHDYRQIVSQFTETLKS